jgi:hypothetical protein
MRPLETWFIRLEKLFRLIYAHFYFKTILDHTMLCLSLGVAAYSSDFLRRLIGDIMLAKVTDLCILIGFWFFPLERYNVI